MQLFIFHYHKFLSLHFKPWEKKIKKLKKSHSMSNTLQSGSIMRCHSDSFNHVVTNVDLNVVFLFGMKDLNVVYSTTLKLNSSNIGGTFNVCTFVEIIKKKLKN